MVTSMWNLNDGGQALGWLGWILFQYLKSADHSKLHLCLLVKWHIPSCLPSRPLVVFLFVSKPVCCRGPKP